MKRPTLQGIQWLLAGIGVLVLLVASVVSAVVLVAHFTDAPAIRRLEARAAASAKAAARSSREGLAIVHYLIGADEAICVVVHKVLPTLHCPPAPRL